LNETKAFTVQIFQPVKCDFDLKYLRKFCKALIQPLSELKTCFLS